MKLDKALRRERKRNKRTSGMQVDNKNIFVLEEEKRKKAEWERRRKEKEVGLLTTE